ncbi:MAG TPA: O-antigen ligase family protein [Usitatibacter sp.]|nr:O-antigen ligase family protein [Usitatibacter sp.]
MRSRSLPRASTLLFAGLLLLLLWAPIPLGSNRPWAWTVLELWAWLLLGCWLLAWALGAVRVPAPVLRAWPAWIVLGLWLALQGLHVVPLPADWVAAVSPESARMQSLAKDIGIERAWMTLSVDPHASRVSLMKSLAYAAIFFLVLALADRRPRIGLLARALVYGALAHAIYAVMMHLSNAREDWFGTLISHGESASGTFANRNHFAGFLEITSALGIGLLIAGLSDRSADSWKRFFRQAIEWILSPKMVLRLTLCVLVIALTTTHSRMGNTAFFSSLLVAGVLGIVLSRRATRNTVLLLASLIAIDLLIVGSWFGVERLAQRLEQTTVQNVQEREDPAVHALPLIRDYALLGAGPGTFYVTFPRYRPDKVAYFYDATHNDYAQLAAETGLVGFGLMGLFVAFALAAALKGQWQRRDPLMRGMSFACVMGVTAILIHSWVDFNLQIPSNAAYFMVLLALGWISLHHDRHVPGLANVRSAEA